MTPPSTTVTDNEKGETVAAKFYTYEGNDESSHVRDFEESVMKECRSVRQAQRAHTHALIARVPRFAISTTAFIVLVAVTLITTFTMGVSSAIALQVGSAMTALYAVVNDVHVTFSEDDSDWRARHRVTAFFIRRHPLDHS